MQPSVGATWFVSLFLSVTAIAGSLSNPAPVEAQQLGDQPIFVPGSSATSAGPEVLRLPAVRARRDTTRGSLEVVRFPDTGRELSPTVAAPENGPSYVPRREPFVPTAWLRGTQQSPDPAATRADHVPRDAEDRSAVPGVKRNVTGAGARQPEQGGAARPGNQRRTAEVAPWRNLSR